MTMSVIAHNQPHLNIVTNAGITSASGIGTYRQGQSFCASLLANQRSIGYMGGTVAYVTNSQYGTQVRGVQMNNFDKEYRGGFENTNRSLDLSSDGRGFMVVDTSGSTDPFTNKEYGFKTTGHYELDKDGYVHDEAGNYLLGVKVSEDGVVPQFSLLKQLDRIQIPMSPSVIKATTEVCIEGSLPVDNVPLGAIKQNAVDVYDSLGVVHQLNFEWSKLDAPLMWRFTAEDSEGAVVAQDSLGGTPWKPTETEDGGIIVRFSDTGVYKGFVLTDNANYKSWDEALEKVLGGIEILEAARRIFAGNPSVNLETLKNALAAIKDRMETNQQEGATAVMAAMEHTTITTAISEGEAKLDELRTAEKDALISLETQFDPDAPLPTVHVSEWRNNTGLLDGAQESDITLSLSSMKNIGNEFQIETPRQNGSGSTEFQSLSISPDGFLKLDFTNQNSQPVWLIPFIEYANNNGMLQDSRNVLRPTPACGTFKLAAPTHSNLGSLRSKMVVSSNVEPQETLLKAHVTSQAAQTNATLYQMSMKLDSHLLNVFAQI